MTGSGLIYAAIVAAWVAYLVPSWVRRDEGRTHAERSTERMRVLRDGRPRVGAGPGDPAEGRARREPVAVSWRTARRRRRALALLVLTLLGTSVGALIGSLAAWAPVLPAVGLLLYLRALRRSVRRMALARRRAEARRAVRRIAGPPPLRSAGPHVSVRLDVAATATPAVAAPAARTDVAAEPASQPAYAPEPAGTGAPWQPQPVPLPTYVTAPKAARQVRTIDLDAPGAWTSGRLDPLAVGTPMPSWVGATGADRSAAEEPEPAAAEELDVETTGEIVLPRRAVGG